LVSTALYGENAAAVDSAEIPIGEFIVLFGRLALLVESCSYASRLSVTAMDAPS
jgi:hypothetical protein